MRNVEIEVFKIAQTSVDRNEVRRWIDHLAANEFEIPGEDATTNPALLIALSAKRCYMSFQPGLNPNVTKVRRDLVEYIDNILKSGHGSVFEHAVFTFAIEGVSRVFTGEMNRHRAGVGISEGSMRYIRLTDIPWWLPTSLRPTREEEDARRRMDTSEYAAETTAETKELAASFDRKVDSQRVIQDHMLSTERSYAKLQKIWEDQLAPESKFHGKKQVTSMMRRIIPMGVATGGVWTLNARALRHVIALRASPAAEEEICLVFSKIAKLMAESEPSLFGDFSATADGYWVPKYPKV